MTDNTAPTSVLQDRLVRLLIVVAIIAVLIAVLVPSKSRIPRELVDGKDQFQWWSQLSSEDPTERKRAVDALCEIMTRGNPTPRGIAARALSEADAKEAIPLLQMMLESDDEELRNEASRTIEEIASRKATKKDAER